MSTEQNSMFANIGCYVGVSLRGRPTVVETSHATLFVDVFRHRSGADRSRL